MPFDFIANLHNAPVFHAAQTLGTHGATLAVATERHLESRFHPLLLAAQSLPNGGQAAVGWAYEHQTTHANTREGSTARNTAFPLPWTDKLKKLKGRPVRRLRTLKCKDIIGRMLPIF